MFSFTPAHPHRSFKLCATCVHFIVPGKKMLLDDLAALLDGKCALYGKVDPVTGRRTFDGADAVRRHGACGEKGRYHEHILTKSD